jgi:pSer/pThr/pTyr-binding forkhead associated (FHA) protein
MDPRFENDAQTGTLPGLSPGEVPGRPQPPAWLAETRSGLTTPGRYLAFEQDGRQVVIPLSREWTRIGRSLAADIRFDDATVSRRHALLASEEGGVRVLDDRSLNGI